MSDKDYSQLTSTATIGDTDLLAVYPTGGPLKKVTFLVFLTRVIASLGSTYLTTANNLSDLASASAARANLGLGTAATLASSAVFQVADNLSEVASASTARANIGAAAADAPTITSGMTYSGSTKQNVQAIASTAIDWSLSECQTKSISAGTTFTFTGFTTGKAQFLILELTISSAAVPVWPASVKWAGGSNPSSALGNGRHVLGFSTFDGGTTVTGYVAAVAAA